MPAWLLRETCEIQATLIRLSESVAYIDGFTEPLKQLRTLKQHVMDMCPQA